HVLGVDYLGEFSTDELDLGLFKQAAKCFIRLKNAAVGRHQYHADRGMRKRAVEPVLAVLQLGDMPRGIPGFTLGRSDPLLLDMLGCLDLLEIEVKCRQKHSDDRRRREQDPCTEAVEAHEQEAG